jgi:hypothetical protein
MAGENGKGESDEDGECEKGVLLSETMLTGRLICEPGRGIGTPFVCRVVGRWATDLDGEDIEE